MAKPEEVILEFLRVGALVRVSAFDPESLTEVFILGDPRAGEAALAAAACRKLAYVLGRSRTSSRA